MALHTRHHARAQFTPSGKLDILSFSWEKHAFENRTHESERLWAPNNKFSKHLGKQDLVEKSLQSNLYYYDMATLPAAAAVFSETLRRFWYRCRNGLIHTHFDRGVALNHTARRGPPEGWLNKKRLTRPHGGQKSVRNRKKV